jgi:hypothetical protein
MDILCSSFNIAAMMFAAIESETISGWPIFTLSAVICMLKLLIFTFYNKGLNPQEGLNIHECFSSILFSDQVSCHGRNTEKILINA